MTGVPTPCPCCGAYSLAPDADTVTLVAVCNVLVVKALEKVGNFIRRQPRGATTRVLLSTPRHLVHTIEQATDDQTARALKGAWDVVPALLDAHGCCGVTSLQVASMLDDYVHDLVLTGTPHEIAELEYRFRSRLGLPVGHEHLEATHG